MPTKEARHAFGRSLLIGCAACVGASDELKGYGAIQVQRRLAGNPDAAVAETAKQFPGAVMIMPRLATCSKAAKSGRTSTTVISLTLQM